MQITTSGSPGCCPDIPAGTGFREKGSERGNFCALCRVVKLSKLLTESVRYYWFGFFFNVIISVKNQPSWKVCSSPSGVLPPKPSLAGMWAHRCWDPLSFPLPQQQEAPPAVSDTLAGWDDSSQMHQREAGLIFQGKGSVFHPGAKLFPCPSGSQVTGTARRGRTPCPASRELSGFI